MADPTQIDASKIFIYGQIGDSLQKRDKERLLGVLQHNPDYFLSLLANQDISGLLDLFREADYKITPELKKLIYQINSNDAIFREIARFMQDSGDMLSSGSMVLGEVDKTESGIWHIRHKLDE